MHSAVNLKKVRIKIGNKSLGFCAVFLFTSTLYCANIDENLYTGGGKEEKQGKTSCYSLSKPPHCYNYFEESKG